jgi:hypothetical protein
MDEDDIQVGDCVRPLRGPPYTLMTVVEINGVYALCSWFVLIVETKDWELHRENFLLEDLRNVNDEILEDYEDDDDSDDRS